EATFLPGAAGGAPGASSRPVGRVGSYVAPGDVSRAVRVLVQPQARVVSVNARGGADLQWRAYGGQARRGPSFTGGARVERRDGRFVLTPARGSAASGGSAVALRLSSLDPAAPLEVNGKVYRGTLEFHPEGSGFIV